MAENKDEGLGIFGWLAIIIVLGALNIAFFGLLYLGLVSSGALNFIIPQASNWELIQTQVYATLPAGGTAAPESLARAAKYLRSTPTSTPFRPPSPTPVPPTTIPVQVASTGVSPSSTQSHTLVKIQGFTAHKPISPLYSAARAAVDWAAFFGITIDEQAFQKKLPASDNPESGFVGDVNDDWGQIPPNSYGIHAPTLATILQSYNVKARPRKNMTLEELLAKIADNKPVIAWVKGSMETGNSVIYTTEDDKSVAVTPYQHPVIVIGYDLGATPPQIIVLNEGKEETYPLTTFMNSWLVLGNMAISAPS